MSTTLTTNTIAKKSTLVRDSKDSVYRRRYIELLADRDFSLSVLCTDFSSALAEELDEVQTHHSDFKAALKRAFSSILSRLIKSDKSVVIFNEAVPSYTLMAFKKNMDNNIKNVDFKEKLNSRTVKRVDCEKEVPESSMEWSAVSQVIECYFQRTGNKVLAIEAEDVLLCFFPVADMKKNLREMGFATFRDA
mgnify:CR=1 FL=1